MRPRAALKGAYIIHDVEAEWRDYDDQKYINGEGKPHEAIMEICSTFK